MQNEKLPINRFIGKIAKSANDCDLTNLIKWINISATKFITDKSETLGSEIRGTCSLWTMTPV